MAQGPQMMWGGVKQGLDQLGEGIKEYGVKKKAKEWSDTIAEKLKEAEADKNKFRIEAAGEEFINDYLRGMKGDLGQGFAPGFTPTREGIPQEMADKVKEFWSLQDQLSATGFGREALQEGFAIDPSMGIGAAERDERAARWGALRDELAPTGLIDPPQGSPDPAKREQMQQAVSDLKKIPWSNLWKPEGEWTKPNYSFSPPPTPEGSVMDRLTDWASGDMVREANAQQQALGTGRYGFPADQRRSLPAVKTDPSLIRRFDEMTRAEAQVDESLAEGESRVADLMAKDSEAQAQPVDMADILRSALASGAAPDNKTFMDTVKEVGRLDEAKSMREYREGLVSDKKAVATNKAKMANTDVSELLRATIPTDGQPGDIHWSTAAEGAMKEARMMGIEPDLAFRTLIDKRAKEMPFGGTESGRALFTSQARRGIVEGTPQHADDATNASANREAMVAILQDEDIAAQFPQLAAAPLAEAEKAFPSGYEVEEVGGNMLMGIPPDRIVTKGGKYVGKAAAIEQGAAPGQAVRLIGPHGEKTNKWLVGTTIIDDPIVARERKLEALAVTIEPNLVEATDKGGNKVRVPEGVGSITGHAASAPEAKDMRERWAAAEEALTQFDILLTAATDEPNWYGGGGGGEMWGPLRAEADAAQAVLIGKLRIALLGPGQMTDAEAERIKKAIPNPREFWQYRDSSEAALLQTRASMMQSIKARATSQGLTFREGSKFNADGAVDPFTAAEVAAGGLPGNPVPYAWDTPGVPVSGATSNVTPMMIERADRSIR